MAKNPYFDDDGLDDNSSFEEEVARPPVAPSLPSWAQITADLPSSDKPAQPNRPGASKPKAAKPATPPAPPAAPTGVPGAAQTAVPTPPPAVPVTPVAVPAPAVVSAPEPVAPAPAPVEVPAPAPTPAPAPAPAPASVEVPAQRETRKPSERRAVNARAQELGIDFDTENRSPILPPEEETYIPEGKGKKGKNAKQSAKNGKNQKPAKGNMAAGGRWKLVALRVGVWGALLVIMLSGVKSILTPASATIPKVTEAVLAALGRNGFPMEAGEQMGERFAVAYLTYDSNSVLSRLEDLQSYLAKDAKDNNLFTSLQAENDVIIPQKVVGGPFLATAPELVDDTHVVFTYAVKVLRDGKGQKPEWVYLSVPMIANDKGAVAVAGAPAIVPGVAIVSATDNKALDYVFDDVAARDAQSSIEKFFGLWAASDKAGLAPYLQTDASTSAASAGLGGAVKLQSMTSLTIEKLDEKNVPQAETCAGPDWGQPCRRADVTVTWSANGVLFVQNYRMILYNDQNYWRVLDIQGGSYVRD